MQHFPFSVWLILIGTMPYRFIHVFANRRIPSFHGWIIVHCRYIDLLHFLYPFIRHGSLGFHMLAVMNNATRSRGVQISLWDNGFIYIGYIPSSGSARLYDNSTFNVLRKLQTVFHSGGAGLHSHPQYTRLLFVHILTSICYHLFFW